MKQLSEENQDWYRENNRNYISASGRVFLSDCVYEKLLEVQQRIDELEKENAELEGSVRVLETMLKPDGYVDDEEHYHTPEDYVDGLLTVDSKVGEQFSITPYVLLPEETYVITKLDENAFEIEQLQEQE